MEGDGAEPRSSSSMSGVLSAAAAAAAAAAVVEATLPLLTQQRCHQPDRGSMKMAAARTAAEVGSNRDVKG